MFVAFGSNVHQISLALSSGALGWLRSAFGRAVNVQRCGVVDRQGDRLAERGGVLRKELWGCWYG
jgi:hypothetical protein